MIYGLTGGIGSGKSTVSGMFRELGAYVVDADVWARRVVEPGSVGLKEIVQSFGRDMVTDDGHLDRPALGALIFRDPIARNQLNDITHPKVRAGMAEETEAYLRSRPGEPVIWDVPLLFEGASLALVDKTIVVYVDETTQLERLKQRNGFSDEEALLRIRSQMPIAEKRDRADYVIDNRGFLDSTREQVQRLWDKFRTVDPSSL